MVEWRRLVATLTYNLSYIALHVCTLQTLYGTYTLYTSVKQLIQPTNKLNSNAVLVLDCFKEANNESDLNMATEMYELYLQNIIQKYVWLYLQVVDEI